MKIIRDDKGQMLILTALSMTVLFGFLAFATDVGLMFRSKRNVQIAADAAATAGALDLNDGSTTAIATQDAYCAAYANGYEGTNVSYTCNNVVPTNPTDATITINLPPSYGYHAVSPYVEAIITEPNPTIFMNMFGIHSMDVSARAVAGPAGHTKDCMWLMNPTGTDLYLQGSATIEAQDGAKTCSIYVNSSDPAALYVTGQGNTITATSVDVVGGQGGHGAIQAPVNTGILPQSPPNLPTAGPPLSDCGSGNTLTALPTTSKIIDASSLDPINNVVCFNMSNPDLSGYTIQNGVFLFENGVTIGNGSETYVNSATVDVYGGVLTVDTNSSFTAATAGPYNGISLLIPPTNTTYPVDTPCKKNGSNPPEVMLQFGSSSSHLDGMIVAPNATIELHDQGGQITASAVYAGAFCSYPGTLVLPSYSDVHPFTTPLKTVALVE
jgi:Flp pilus assembly protein TadG